MPIRTPGLGSAFGLYVLDGPAARSTGRRHPRLHLAAVNHGVYYGTGGEFGLSTALTDAQMEEASAALRSALADVAKASAVVERV